MPWGRLDDRANSDAKLLALSDAAWRMWGCGIIYCNFNLTDGFIPEHAIHTFGVRAKNKDVVADELCRSLVPGKGPLWHRIEGGFRVHDYLDWNDSKEKVERERVGGKRRLDAFRKRKKKRVSTDVVNADDNAKCSPVHDQYHRELSEEQESSRGVRARVFTGKRLKVSAAQHQVVLDELGPIAAKLDWQALYATWDAELESSGESFDVLVFVKARAAESVRRVPKNTPPEVDWFEECKQLHDLKCGGRLRHHNQMLIDDEKARMRA